MYRGNEFFTSRGLDEVARSPGAQRLGYELNVRMHRQKNDLGRGARLFELADRVEAAQDWHRNVRDNDVGTQFLGGVDHRAAVADYSDKFELVFQQASQPFGDDRVIISQQDP